MPMIRCGFVPARMPRIFASRIASTIGLGNRRFKAINLSADYSDYAEENISHKKAPEFKKNLLANYLLWTPAAALVLRVPSLWKILFLRNLRIHFPADNDFCFFADTFINFFSTP